VFFILVFLLQEYGGLVFKLSLCDYGVSGRFEGFICLFALLACGGRNLVRIHLYVKVRSKSRSSIVSVPLKKLVQLSVFPKRSWSFKDGWLVLEGTI
jgi:hypothetical protein